MPEVINPLEMTGTCAPSADSILTLKERMKTLDDMVLAFEDNSDSDQTDDNKSVA